VEFKSTYITPTPIMMLQVDNQLKTIVNSQDQVDQTIVGMMDADMVEKIRTQQYIVLPPHQVSHFCSKTSQTDLRGTPILKRALKALVLKDCLRLLQKTVLERHTFPLKIFKLGNQATGWIPPRSHFETFRNLLMQAAGDPDFSIIFHHGLTTEFLGTKDKIENLIPHLEWCDKEIMTALFTNAALMSGQGVTYANANVSVRILMSRYQTLRARMELMFNNKIFYQMAKARGYYVSDKTGNSGRKAENINGKYMLLDLPKFRWQKLNLLDDTSQKQFIMKLRDKLEVPHKLISEVFDLEEEDMRRQLDEEDGSVVDPVYIDARKKAAADAHIREQVLKHVKTSKWETDKGDAETEKKKPAPTKGPTPTLNSDITEQPAAEDVSGGTPAPGATPATPPTV
jgi:hypothetical protein